MSEDKVEDSVIRGIDKVGLVKGEYRDVASEIWKNKNSAWNLLEILNPFIYLTIGWILKQTFILDFFVENDFLTWFINFFNETNDTGKRRFHFFHTIIGAAINQNF